jgi:hypothetical protein
LTGVVGRSLSQSPSLARRLYNERPTWLTNAQRDLDTAVAAACGWAADISEDDALAALLELNAESGAFGGLESNGLDRTSLFTMHSD